MVLAATAGIPTKPMLDRTLMMNFQSNPDHNRITQTIVDLTGLAFKSVALVCSDMLDEVFQTVNAYLSPDERSPKFRHAIEMELSYCRALIGFDEIAPPNYGCASDIDWARMVCQFGVAHVYCVVTMSADGVVRGYRNYDAVEMTILQAIEQQLGRIRDMLEENAGVTSSFGWRQ